MKKVRIFLLVLVMVLSFVFVVGCDKHEHEFVEGKCECGETDPNYVDPLDQLANEMESLETASATINCTMSMTMKMTMDGESESETMNADMYIESDNVKTYTITTVEGEKQYMYTVVEGDLVKQYAKLDEEWTYIDAVSVEDYSTNTDLFNIEVKDVFTLQDGVWVGNVETLSQVLETTMEDIAADLGGVDGISLDETTIKKYNITMTDGKISLIDIEMYIKMSYQGMVMEISYAMPMHLSKVGETTVTTPTNLPQE